LIIHTQNKLKEKIQVYQKSMKEESNSNQERLIPEKKKRPHYVFDSLRKLDIWGYSVGHIFNDLCAAAWFK